jgi:hypothetical protein
VSATVGIVVFPGSNCEHDVAITFARSQASLAERRWGPHAFGSIGALGRVPHRSLLPGSR